MDSRRKKRLWPALWRVLLALLAVVAVFGALNYKTLVKIYHGITLFKPEKLTENFRSLDQWFDSRKVAAGSAVSSFDYDLQDLPSSYVYKGHTKDVGQFIDETHTTGLVVTRNGSIVYEEYFRGNNDASRCILWSVSKSVVSALVGIAVDEGFIRDIHEPVTAYVPSLAASGYNGVSIKDVLQMSSGIRFTEDYADPKSDISRLGPLSVGLGPSLESFLLELDREHEPGTRRKYVSSDAQVLGMVVRAAVGMDLASYMEEKLWRPAGMEGAAYWLLDSTGVESAFGGLNACLRDLARFGNLYLNDGYWNGRQIISKEWIRASVTPDAPHLLPGANPRSDSVLGYGYQWWVPGGEDRDFLAMGIYGQAVYVNPRYNVVIARTAAYKGYTIDGVEMELESVEFFRAIARHLGTDSEILDNHK